MEECQKSTQELRDLLAQALKVYRVPEPLIDKTIIFVDGIKVGAASDVKKA